MKSLPFSMAYVRVQRRSLSSRSVTLFPSRHIIPSPAIRSLRGSGGEGPAPLPSRVSQEQLDPSRPRHSRMKRKTTILGSRDAAAEQLPHPTPPHQGSAAGDSAWCVVVLGSSTLSHSLPHTPRASTLHYIDDSAPWKPQWRGGSIKPADAEGLAPHLRPGGLGHPDHFCQVESWHFSVC